MRAATAKTLRSQVANDNGGDAVPSASPSLWPGRLKRAGDTLGDWFADAFIIGGALLLLTASGWL